MHNTNTNVTHPLRASIEKPFKYGSLTIFYCLSVCSIMTCPFACTTSNFISSKFFFFFEWVSVHQLLSILYTISLVITHVQALQIFQLLLFNTVYIVLTYRTGSFCIVYYFLCYLFCQSNKHLIMMHILGWCCIVCTVIMMML